MAFVSFASSLLLSLLLCFSLTAYAGDETLATYPPAEAPHPPPPHHKHHHHPPPPPPTKPPTPPPRHKSPPPPSHPPPPPPTHKHPPPPRHPSPPPPAHKYPPPPPPPTHKYPPPPPTHKHPPPPSPKYPPPSPPPSHPPVKPPAKPPTYPPMRKKVAVQGVVYCKSCKYRGVDTLSGATPLSGAIVKLQCKNTKYTLKEQKTTDKNGYFFFMPPTLTTAGSHKCKVTLVSSPLATCNVPTNLHGGALSALLTRPRKPPVDAPKKPLPFELFTVGPFAFEASKKLPCHY